MKKQQLSASGLLRTLLLLTTSFSLSAQQEPAITQFWNVNAHYNPAVAGLEYKHAANVLYRNQWDKVNGAPNFLFANYSAKVSKLHGGAGISYCYSTIGLSREHTILGNYAFHLAIGKNTLSLGVGAGTFISTSALYANSAVSRFRLNSGIAFHAEKWNAGFSISNLAEDSPFKSGNYGYTGARHYSLFADYTFDINEYLAIRPRVQAVTDAVKYNCEIALMATIYQQFECGLAYRTSEAVGILAGYNFRQRYRISYSYDLTINQLSSVSRGTHEISVAYLLK